MVDGIANIGLQGVKRGIESAAQHADQLSRAFTESGDGDAVTPIVGLKTDALQVQASARVIAIADSLSGTILDILA